MFPTKIKSGPSGLYCIRAIFIFSALILLAFTWQPVRADVLTEEQWLDLGWDYYNAGDLEEAFNTFLQAVDDYPESAEAHMALGEVYIEMGIIDRGQTELLLSLRYDDESPLAARAHYTYAVTIREEDTWQALLHLNRAHRLGGSTHLQFEIANQIRFCNLVIQMPGRSESGPVVLHYPDYLLEADDADTLALDVEASVYLAETYCYFDVAEPFHIFLYPSERAVRAEIRLVEDDYDPVHREYHIPYAPGIDFLPYMCMQVVRDLQDDMNRHAGAVWVPASMPYAITAVIPWTSASDSEAEPGQINIDDATRSLYTDGVLVDLTFIIAEDFYEYIPDPVLYAELASFLGWIRRYYPEHIFREIVTQPNLELVLDDEIGNIQNKWIDALLSEGSLLSDPELAGEWVGEQALSHLSGDIELPMRILKEGLRLYLDGEVVNGLWEIRRALDIDPGLALGYYTLGWIAANEDDFEEAEEQLSMAIMLFEQTGEIAWCHAMLAPIYLLEQRWDTAHAGLNYVASYAGSEQLRGWAANLTSRTGHILSLRPSPPLDPETIEFRLMYTYFQNFSTALNSDDGAEDYISELMNMGHAANLYTLYNSIRDEHPSVQFNHVVQSVGQSGSAMLVEVRVYADFQGYRPMLSSNYSPLLNDGYLLYFQVIPAESSWQILDWENGWFPIPELRETVQQTIELDMEEQGSDNPFRN